MRLITCFGPAGSAQAGFRQPKCVQKFMRTFARTGLHWVISASLFAAMAALPAAAQDELEEEEPESIDDMFSLGVYYWKPTEGTPRFDGGETAIMPENQKFNLPSKPNQGLGAELTIPTGGFNRLEIGYWQVKDSGAFRTPRELDVFNNVVAAGELMTQQYELTNIRIAWNYLTFPVPPLDARFRIKTFWEFQSTQFKGLLTLPEAVDEGVPIPFVEPDESIRLPGAGIGFEFVPTRAFRMEGRLSGMAFPGRSRYADAQVSAVGRIAGHLEIFAGLKGFHFRTSPKDSVIFLEGTIVGPFGGIRWVFN